MSSTLESLFPPGIPIGTVTRVDDQAGSLFERVHVTPYADLRTLDFVQVLVAPKGSATASASPLRAQAP